MTIPVGEIDPRFLAELEKDAERRRQFAQAQAQARQGEKKTRVKIIDGVRQTTFDPQPPR